MTIPSNDGGEKFFQLGTKAVIVKNNKVLMLKTNRNYSGGKVFWDFPGGRMKQASGTTRKDIETNIKREVEEETGISKLTVGDFVHAIMLPYDVSFKVRNYGLVIFFYKCTFDGQSKIKLSWEHTQYSWFAKKELPKDLQRWYREAIVKVLD